MAGSHAVAGLSTGLVSHMGMKFRHGDVQHEATATTTTTTTTTDSNARTLQPPHSLSKDKLDNLFSSAGRHFVCLVMAFAFSELSQAELDSVERTMAEYKSWTLQIIAYERTLDDEEEDGSVPADWGLLFGHFHDSIRDYERWRLWNQDLEEAARPP